MIKKYPKTPEGVYNVLEPGAFRDADGINIKAVAVGNLPYFLLRGGGMGIVLNLSFVNGKSWDEAQRSDFIEKIEDSLLDVVKDPYLDFTFAFRAVRTPLGVSGMDLGKPQPNDPPATLVRKETFRTFASDRRLQNLELYFSMTAVPTAKAKDLSISLTESIRMKFNKTLENIADVRLLEDVATKFGDAVKAVASSLGSEGFGVTIPRTPEELLTVTRRAWRPFYKSPHDEGKTGADTKLKLKKGVYQTPATYLTEGLRLEQFSTHFLSDGCLNIVFTMEQAPDPDKVFESVMADKLQAMGVEANINAIPWYGAYTVAIHPMDREAANSKFKLKLMLSSVGKGSGFFRDREGEKREEQIAAMFDEFVAGKSEMSRSSVLFHLMIPLSEVPELFQVSRVSDEETLRGITEKVEKFLGSVGSSKWVVEPKTGFTSFIHSIPGGVVSNSSSYLPGIYTTVAGALYLSPLFSTTSKDENRFDGSNFFVTEEGTPFVFDHFSKNNGAAFNFAICGETGSGKSVVAQSLVMSAFKAYNPVVTILDFGGGNVGSWTKLCAVVGGVELKFGSANPPRINPFELSPYDSLPNNIKKERILKAIKELGRQVNRSEEEIFKAIDAVYTWLRAEDSPNVRPADRVVAVTEKLPELLALVDLEECGQVKGLGEDSIEIMNKFVLDLFELKAGEMIPGEKGRQSIKINLELLLADEVGDAGPVGSPWTVFSWDAVAKVVMDMYNETGATKDNEWPTLTTFVGLCQHKYKHDSLPALTARLGTYTRGGLDPFLDGQTNVQMEMDPQKIKMVVADMAGISDPRKKALFMILTNDYFSGIMYRLNGRRGLLIRDEAWLILKSPIAAPYVEADSRLARKYGFSIMTISQQLSDFIGGTMENNTQNWIVCKFNADSEIALAAKKFKLNSHEKSLFEDKKMGTKIERDIVSGKVINAYSRILIANNSGRYILKNMIGAAEMWITTTDDNETFVFNYFKEGPMRGQPVINIVNYLCEKDAQGRPLYRTKFEPKEGQALTEFELVHNKEVDMLLEAIRKAGRRAPNI